MLWAALFVVTFCGAVMAQDTGSITGTVKDSSGAEVAGAAVQVSSDTHGINRQTVSNATGDFSEAALPGGTYDVIVTAPGFKKTQVKGVVLDVAQKARVDITLQVGTINTEIVVQGEDVAQVETQSSELAGTVTGKEISQLELNGRNFTQLATLTPGVSNQTGQDEGTVGVYGSVSFSMNGGRTEYNNWELDGGDNMDNGSNGSLNVYPSLDAIAEFKVLTSNYGAQYGRNGSGTVEVETKSGTNSFHGNVYEYLRNDDFNSPAWFEGGVAPEYKKNDYGYTLGGPVFIPNHYNKDKKKTFFFWSEEWRKDLVPGQTFNLPVPSIAERGGDFTDLCSSGSADCPNTPNPNISTLPAFTANQATAQALLAEIPEPTGPGAATCTPGGATNPCNFTASPAQATNWREELIRVDQNINDKNRATFRFIHDSWNTTTAVPLWTNQGSFPTIQSAFKGPGVGLVARLTTTASPTLLNEFVFSYTTDHIILNDTGNWKRPASFSSGFTDLFPGNGGGVLPGINLVDPNGAYGNFGEDAGYIPNGVYNSNPTYTFRDNVSKTLGKHVLQFGVYLAFAQKNEFGGELASGSYPGYLTFDPNKDNATTGNPFADLLLGNIYSFGQQDHLLKYYNRYKLYEPYFQDDWRITNRLTLNLGIRLSLYETYREKQKQAFNFDPKHYVAGQTTVNQDDSVNFLTADGGIPSLTDLPNGMVQCGVTPGVPDGCMKQHIFNPAPRIGFAWDPKGDGKWAVRGGYGVFFEHTNGNEANTESLENSPPLATVVQKLQIPGYENINSGAASQQFPLNVNSIPDKAIYPYMQQWHFDIQHDVAKNTIATVSYVGSKGTHLTRQSDLNQLMPTPINQNPFQSGESFGATACTNPDAFGIPQNGTTPSGTVIPYSVNSNGLPSGPAVNVGIANCGALPDPLRPFPGYGTITHLESAASSTYHAFQASLRRNVGQFTISAAYTYSHSIDDSSDRSDGGLVNTYNFATNRASSNFDERHIFNFSYVWDVPFFKGKGITHAFLGGWEYSGIVGISSGTPFSVLSSGDIAGVGSGVGDGARADLVGDPNQVVRAATAGTGPLWYNPNAFATASPLTFGNTGRNDLRNPRRTNFDMALFKQFPVHEAMAFQFRAEAYNVFNHTEWGGIAGDSGSAGGAGNNTVGADNFLFVTTVHNPRILQLALKFIF
jgi:Carboxypeptidase regulatory-like domain